MPNDTFCSLMMHLGQLENACNYYNYRERLGTEDPSIQVVSEGGTSWFQIPYFEKMLHKSIQLVKINNLGHTLLLIMGPW